ncbi:hypothetical protein G6O46_24000, partial [Salmonella enterica subsp. enterica serovar Enteritidis]|uniref:hypothetical protein n=1 Tax=Salmonella enterica TaxID=28901 RepID=UPI001654B37F
MRLALGGTLPTGDCAFVEHPRVRRKERLLPPRIIEAPYASQKFRIERSRLEHMTSKALVDDEWQHDALEDGDRTTGVRTPGMSAAREVTRSVQS